ncbi:2-keto-3-deoxygluconate kinase [Halosimplex carlsbadense 2-9-1]|uniref:2-keto-3-deoxygluconate kinase n=1 Tax=Halosimplex carlsbadense 2-9-1 TaxID=797114 RepID=M0CYE0_9EURY|nr:sugar kinase [Halosimplex carlsbadense]ELZ26904.1 2-keto-3-deoxygluconate kinase [Halosimplex carlsbadense 2-9-1]
MTELVTFGETSLRLSPAGEERLETAEDVRMRVSGTESNVAVAASAMGADATWLSKLPDSPLGRRVERSLHAHGVDTEIAWAEKGRQGLQFDEQAPAPRTDRLVQDRDRAAAASVTPGELPMDRIQRADATFVAGSTLSLSGDIVETAEAVLRAAGNGLVAMDLDFQPGLWSVEAARETLDGVFDAVDVLIANEDQARTIFDRTDEPRTFAHALASKRSFDTVVITRSDRGALVCSDGVIHEQDGIEVDAVDPAGQHEAFAGAFLERVLSGAGASEALTHGVASATLARTIPGSMTTASREEVEALVDQLGDGR